MAAAGLNFDDVTPDQINALMAGLPPLPTAQGKSVTAPPPAQQKPKPATPTPPKGKAGIEKLIVTKK